MWDSQTETVFWRIRSVVARPAVASSWHHHHIRCYAISLAGHTSESWCCTMLPPYIYIYMPLYTVFLRSDVSHVERSKLLVSKCTGTPVLRKDPYAGGPRPVSPARRLQDGDLAAICLNREAILKCWDFARRHHSKQKQTKWSEQVLNKATEHGNGTYSEYREALAALDSIRTNSFDAEGCRV